MFVVVNDSKESSFNYMGKSDSLEISEAHYQKKAPKVLIRKTENKNITEKLKLNLNILKKKNVCPSNSEHTENVKKQPTILHKKMSEQVNYINYGNLNEDNLKKNEENTNVWRKMQMKKN